VKRGGKERKKNFCGRRRPAEKGRTPKAYQGQRSGKSKADRFDCPIVAKNSMTKKKETRLVNRLQKDRTGKQGKPEFVSFPKVDEGPRSGKKKNMKSEKRKK